jgi:TnpA family transposase
MCIHSSVNTSNSSEVAAMLHGLLNHNTNKEVDRNFVDTHGQSEVGFAFCHLLGFKLMPRLKNIGSQKLYKPKSGVHYPHLQPVLVQKPIDWDLIRRQYDEMVKYATALRLNVADTESILGIFAQRPEKVE